LGKVNSAEMAVKSLVSYFIPAKSPSSFVIIGRFGIPRNKGNKRNKGTFPSIVCSLCGLCSLFSQNHRYPCSGGQYRSKTCFNSVPS
jgi:hypothetical protein